MIAMVPGPRTFVEQTDEACPTCVFPIIDHRERHDGCEACQFGDGHACYCYDGVFSANLNERYNGNETRRPCPLCGRLVGEHLSRHQRSAICIGNRL